MSLEEKIAAMSPDLREKVEDYVDYLLSRGQQEDPIASMIPPVYMPDKASDDTPIGQKLRIPGTRDPSGIILAEEIPRKKNDLEAIDFADINTRFAKSVDETESSPRRSKRMFDWL